VPVLAKCLVMSRSFDNLATPIIVRYFGESRSIARFMRSEFLHRWGCLPLGATSCERSATRSRRSTVSLVWQQRGVARGRHQDLQRTSGQHRPTTALCNCKKGGGRGSAGIIGQTDERRSTKARQCMAGCGTAVTSNARRNWRSRMSCV